MLKAVLFDMDGVIIDSEPLHAKAAVQALRQNNISIPLDYMNGFIGCTTFYMCERMVNDYQLSLSPEELLRSIDDSKKHLVETEGYAVIPHVIDLIKDLHRHGIKMMIASSSSPEAIEEVMNTLQIKEYFDGYVAGSMVAHPKPAPDIFLLAANHLKVQPNQCIVIEDSCHGVNAAASAGIISIGFVNPNSGKQDLKKAAILVEGFDEVDCSFVNRIYQAAHKEPVTITATEHFVLRELAVEDMEALFKIYCHPEIKTHLENFSEDLNTEYMKLKAYIDHIYGYYGYGQWGVFLKTSNLLVGRCGIEYKLFDQEEIYELGYLLDPNYQGHGYAREFTAAVIQYSFQQLALPKITAIIEPENKRSIHLAVSLGMQYTGECSRNQRVYMRYDLVNDHH